MSAARLPGELAAGLETLGSATEALIAAANRADSEAIEEALGRRALAIERLEPLVTSCRDAGGAEELALLAAESARLEAQAARADEALRGIGTRIRDDLSRQGRNGRAIRAYTATAVPSGQLNRSR